VSAHWLTKEHESKRMATLLENLCIPRWMRIVPAKHSYGRWNKGLRFHPRVEKKLHDLETSLFTHYTHTHKLNWAILKKIGNHVLGLWRPLAVKL
jgi:hypothetical protein